MEQELEEEMVYAQMLHSLLFQAIMVNSDQIKLTQITELHPPKPMVKR
jgi:hypothetical protein